MTPQITDLAKSIIAGRKSMYNGSYTVEETDESSFPHLDMGAYRTLKAEMESASFRYIADTDIRELSLSKTTVLAPTMIRSFISDNGEIQAAYYQVKPRIGRRFRAMLEGLANFRLLDAPAAFMRSLKTRHCVDFSTEFSDGSFLIISNAQSAGAVAYPPTVETRIYPYGTANELMLEYHRKRMSEILDRHSKIRAIPVATLTDILESHKRSREIKAAYRATIQWITHSEVHALSSKNPELADALFFEIQRLLQEPEAIGDMR